MVLEHFLSKDQIECITNDLEPSLCALRPGLDSGDEHPTRFFGEQIKRLNNLATVHISSSNNGVLDSDSFHGICDKMFLQESGSFWVKYA